MSLDDGTYDAFIMWVDERDNGVALECTITAGAHKGDVISIVTSANVTREPMSLIGLPCTIVVAGDAISVRM
jgi:hypothetical protein